MNKLPQQPLQYSLLKWFKAKVHQEIFFFPSFELLTWSLELNGFISRFNNLIMTTEYNDNLSCDMFNKSKKYYIIIKNQYNSI